MAIKKKEKKKWSICYEYHYKLTFLIEVMRTKEQKREFKFKLWSVELNIFRRCRYQLGCLLFIQFAVMLLVLLVCFFRLPFFSASLIFFCYPLVDEANPWLLLEKICNTYGLRFWLSKTSPLLWLFCFFISYSFSSFDCYPKFLWDSVYILIRTWR